MAFDALPEGFRWAWGKDSVRIGVPPLVRSDDHVYEPVLSTRDADAVADAIVRHEKKRQDAGVSHRLARVRIAHDSAYSEATLARFRAKLAVALVERGQELAIDDTVTLSGAVAG
jgi:hypothetical protein